jgi:branched-chain amino acid aminotransferase
MSQGGEQNGKIWRDGRIINWADATIHVISHVVHYGSGVFEGVRSYDTPSGGAVFRLQDHMRRMVDSCRIYRMQMRWSADELCQAVLDTIAANNMRAAYIRPLAIRTGESLGVGNVKAPIETFVIVRPATAYLGEDGMRNGVDVGVSSWRRSAPGTLPMMAKASGNYLSSQLANMEATRNGYVEALMLDHYGYLSEGSGENVFVVRDGVLYTSPLGAGILNGITRDSIIRIATDFGIHVSTENLPREMLYAADEVFFCGTAVEVTPIRSIDGVSVGDGKPGPITRKIQNEFLGIAQGRLADRYGWLTPVPEGAAVG